MKDKKERSVMGLASKLLFGLIPGSSIYYVRHAHRQEEGHNPTENYIVFGILELTRTWLYAHEAYRIYENFK